MEKAFKKLNKKLLDFISGNYLLVSLFIISSIYFVFQHYVDISWDFAAYFMNAKFLFAEGSYFEVYRSPMISIILGFFIWLGKATEYIYILIVSGLFFYSSVKLSDVLYEKYFYKYGVSKGFVRFVFYFFLLSPFLLEYGLIGGTELLGFAFFQMFLAFLISGRKSGYWLGFAFLSRYTFLVFTPFLFFSKDYKKILKNIGLFALSIFPWFLFNFIVFGNWFASFLDSYYLNILSRQDMVQPFNFSSLLPVAGNFIPFLALGGIAIVLKVKNINKRRLKNIFKEYKYEILFLLVFVFLLFKFYNTPFKVERYLFNMVLPVAFFSCLGIFFFLAEIFKKFPNIKTKALKTISLLLFLWFLISISGAFSETNDKVRNDKMYKSASEDIVEMGFGNCQVLSNHWVPVNYYNENAWFLSSGIRDAFSNKNLVLVFQRHTTMDDNYNKEIMKNSNILKKTNNYTILAPEGLDNKTCNRWEGHSSTIKDEHCQVLREKFEDYGLGSFAFKSCRLINFNF